MIKSRLMALKRAWKTLYASVVIFSCIIVYQEIRIILENRKISEHTYIIAHYGLISHTIYGLCVTFIHERGDVQFKIYSKRQIFKQIFHGNFYLLSGFIPENCWEKVAGKILYKTFLFGYIWPGVWVEALCLRNQHTTTPSCALKNYR